MEYDATTTCAIDSSLCLAKTGVASAPMPTIKHIVMSGGGICGFSFYGALREAERSGFWNINNIKSIYGTSIGAFIAVIISLKGQFDWETLDDYLIKRPWDELFQLNMTVMYNAIKNKGILDQSFIISAFEPLFNAVDMSTDISIREFYEMTGVDIHIIVSKIKDIMMPSKCEFVLEDMNYRTHGEWKLIDAVYCSACLPIMFRPFVHDGAYYIDGGLICNYPVCLCKDENIDEDEIFGLCSDNEDKKIELDGVFDYLFALLSAMWHKITRKSGSIKYEISMKTPTINLKDILETAQLRETRLARINEGGEYWKQFYSENISGRSHTENRDVYLNDDSANHVNDGIDKCPPV